jgi:hypothetical protein
MGVLPVAGALRQIAPWDLGTVPSRIEDRFDEAMVVFRVTPTSPICLEANLLFAPIDPSCI